MIKLGLIKFFVKKAIFYILFFSSFVSPFAANAGVFSFVSSLFGVSEASILQPIKNLNSQNMALLTATINYNADASIGGGGINIDNSALSAENGPNGVALNTENKTSPGNIALYIVRGGDTLGQIAKMFGVSVGTIMWANDIQRGNLITEGQILSILPIDAIEHIVVKGDTLQKIVEKYKGDLKETEQYNNLSQDYVLAIGNKIIIPDGEMALPASNSTQITTNPIRGANGPEYTGYYIRPIIGGRISQGLHGYNAIDFAAPLGTPILASAAGKVLISKDNDYWNGGYGNYIVIQHNNGTQTLYSHNSSNIVWAGYAVAQGQVIGYIGSTGRSTGPHVHFEVRGAQNPWANY